MTHRFWDAADPLGEALHFLRMSGAFYSRAELSAPWGLELPAMPGHLMFHVMTAGECRVEAEGMEPLTMHPGDFVLIPHGEGHRLLSRPGVRAASLWDVPREQVSNVYELLEHGGGGERTSMICGAVRFDHPAAQHLVDLLPAAIHLESEGSSQADWMRSTLHLIADEAARLQPGGETVITRLADILVVQAIRTWIETAELPTSWLGALKDRDMGRVIRLIHRHPDRDWSVDSLAREIPMSRSAFTRRFTSLVGESPMAYLTRWRMQLAVSWLEDGSVKVADLPYRLGYGSEAAFSRAFKRTVGMSPGEVRRSAQEEGVGH